MKFYRLILLMLFPAGWRPALRSAAPPQNLQPDQIVLFVNTDNADSQAFARAQLGRVLN